MIESQVWSVDRVAAADLLGSLGVDATPEALEAAAIRLARHRICAQDWAVKRAQSRVVAALESASARHFDRRSNDWIDGFRRAEEIVIVMAAGELVPSLAPQARSKGQVLRSLVRQARLGT